MDFSRAPFFFLIPWPLAILAGIGILAIVAGFGVGVYELADRISITWH